MIVKNRASKLWKQNPSTTTGNAFVLARNRCNIGKIQIFSPLTNDQLEIVFKHRTISHILQEHGQGRRT